MQLWDLHRGDSPVIINVPHAGIALPDALRQRLTPQALAVPDTDWHVERLYAFAREAAVFKSAETLRRLLGSSPALPRDTLSMSEGGMLKLDRTWSGPRMTPTATQ